MGVDTVHKFVIKLISGNNAAKSKVENLMRHQYCRMYWNTFNEHYKDIAYMIIIYIGQHISFRTCAM